MRAVVMDMSENTLEGRNDDDLAVSRRSIFRKYCGQSKHDSCRE